MSMFSNYQNYLTPLSLSIPFISLFLYLTKKYFNGPSANNQISLRNKVVIITGASEGIGRYTSEDILKSGATVIYACRNQKKTEEIISKLDSKYRENAIFIKLDLSSLSSVNEFVNEIKSRYNSIDILINNAGMIGIDYQETEDKIESTIQVNTLSHMYLSQELLEMLNKKNGRIINVSSMGHSMYNITDEKLSEITSQNYNLKNNYKTWFQYCLSKLGNIYFTQYLNEYISQNRLNVTTYSLHPGAIYTELGRDSPVILKFLFNLIYPISWFFFKSIEKGAQTTLFLAYEDKNNLKSGRYYQDCSLGKVAKFADEKESNLRYKFIEYCRREINNTGKGTFRLQVRSD